MNKSIDDILVDLYELYLSRLMSHNSPYINELRKDAIDKFNTYKLPTKRDESYKYSDISKWFASSINEKSTIKLYNCENLAIEQNKEGVVICDMNTFAVEYKDIFKKYYTKSVEDNSIMMLSRAFATGGKVVYVPAKVVCDSVIKISNNTISGDVSLGERNLFIFERESLAKIHIEHNNDGIANCVYEVFVEAGANVEISEEYYGSKESVLVNTISANLMRDTFYKHISVNLSKGKCRVNQYITLADKNGDASVFGAVMSKGEAHIDNTTLIKHSVENCRSYENFKYVTGDTATSVFCGNVFVAAGANGTQAYQQNNNILLDDNASMYSKPNLEIYADDVKCSHGATVGQLDENALFYMRQRGISLDEAKKLMLKGFIKDIVDKISSQEIVDKISEKLENV